MYVSRIMVCTILCFVVFPFKLNAQSLQPCPNGMPAGSGCVPPSSTGGNGVSPPSAPAQYWQDRYGAIAVDYDAVSIGVAEGDVSKRRAAQNAIKRCGTRNCKVVSNVVNGCLASAYGDSRSNNGSGVIMFGYGEGAADAEADALSLCQKSGKGCEIKYVGCSLPVRVR